MIDFGVNDTEAFQEGLEIDEYMKSNLVKEKYIWIYQEWLKIYKENEK